MYTYFLYASKILSCFQINSSYYGDGVSAKLKYLNPYDHIFNPVSFILSLEDRHIESRHGIITPWPRENMSVSLQNNQTSKEIGANISIIFGSSVLYWHIVK